MKYTLNLIFLKCIFEIMTNIAPPAANSVYGKEKLFWYEHQWNTRWAFARKTWYLYTWKDHCCYGHKINRAFRCKKYLKEMIWYFIDVYIINRTLHGRLEIGNFSLSVEKKFHEWAHNVKYNKSFDEPLIAVSIISSSLLCTGPQNCDRSVWLPVKFARR